MKPHTCGECECSECCGSCVIIHVEELSEEEYAAIVGAICNPNGETVQ